MGYGNGGTTPDYTAMQNAAVAPPRMPLVALEMERQAKSIEHLHALIGNLEMRLSAVLRSVGPTGSSIGGNTPAASHPVPLAGGLSDQNTRIEGACGRLNDLLDRVEL